MSFFDWNDGLDVHVEAMNLEHQRLISLMNRLHASLQAQGGDTQALIDDLYAFAQRHFQSEEAYLASIGYPELAKHALVHQTMLRRLGVYREALAGGGPKLVEEFLVFLKVWLSGHIREIDAKYGGAQPATSRLAARQTTRPVRTLGA